MPEGRRPLIDAARKTFPRKRPGNRPKDVISPEGAKQRVAHVSRCQGFDLLAP